jgi:hypothetical protein
MLARAASGCDRNHALAFFGLDFRRAPWFRPALRADGRRAKF